MRVNRILTALADGLAPTSCCLCQWPCQGPLPLCPDCSAELPVNDHPCQRCALPMPPTNGTGARFCGSCLRQPPSFDRVLAPWLYGEYLAHILQRWKFQGEQRLTRLLAGLWLAQVHTPPAVDVMVPIPLHWVRQCRRGYNQSRLLAMALHKQWPEVTVASALLRRCKSTRAQSGMNARQRASNLRAAFTASGACANLSIAVVDDVLTTGATANEAASVLKLAGARHVEIWCLARTPPPGD